MQKMWKYSSYNYPLHKFSLRFSHPSIQVITCTVLLTHYLPDKLRNKIFNKLKYNKKK